MTTEQAQEIIRLLYSIDTALSVLGMIIVVYIAFRLGTFLVRGHW